MSKRQLIIVTCIFWIILIPVITNANDGEIIFSESFESCIPPDWSVDNGVWGCCLHSPPVPMGGGNLYAGTVCNGNYPRSTDSRLITPEIDLTGILLAGDEELVLRFWHWFSYSGGDYGYVQISEYDPSTETWSTWNSISDAIGSNGSAVWSPKTIDLTAYAGKQVKLAFYHYDNNDLYTGVGWHIDNVALILKAPELTWDFECGWDDWSAGNGVWEVDIPEGGPGKAYSGDQCAGTVLDGNYPRTTDSRLVSPTIVLDCVGEIRLRFWHWFSYSGGDYGSVQISEYDPSTETWTAWDSISDPIVNIGAVWSAKNIDLTAYAGKQVKLAFYHYDNNDLYTGAGWYVDHIRIDCDSTSLFPHFCECDLNQEGDCNILDYQRFIQDWSRTDCGTPPGTGLLPNDCECDLNKDGECNILDYQRFIQDWGNMFCEVCP